MKIEDVMEQIGKVRQGKADFASLINQINSQQVTKKKVVAMDAVNNARKLGQNLYDIQ